MPESRTPRSTADEGVWYGCRRWWRCPGVFERCREAPRPRQPMRAQTRSSSFALPHPILPGLTGDGLNWLVVSVLALTVERKHLRTTLDAVFEIGQQSLVRQIECVRMFPVVPGDLVQPIHDAFVARLDRQLAPSVE